MRISARVLEAISIGALKISVFNGGVVSRQPGRLNSNIMAMATMKMRAPAVYPVRFLRSVRAVSIFCEETTIHSVAED